MARSAVEGTDPAAADSPLHADLAGTSWGAIVAGAIAATAMTFVLMLLGSGMGLVVVSPWGPVGVPATTFAVSTAIWLIVTQWISAGFGGYIAGRLRMRWSGIRADEVFFRDTAHGFLAWALATLVVASVLGSTVTAIAGGTAGTIVGVNGMTALQTGDDPAAAYRMADRATKSETAYLVDRLFRVPAPPGVGAPTTATEARAEAQRIVATGLTGTIPDDDRTHLIKLVADRAGISVEDAKLRVSAAILRMELTKSEAQEMTDAARKVAATTTIVGALGLLVGAFIACVAAAIGGRLRDDPPR